MKPRVLVLDDGEVPTRRLCEVLRRSGAEVVSLYNFFDAHALLDSQQFEVLVAHEFLLLLAKEMKLTSRRCLLAATPSEWTSAQLDFMGASAVVSESSSEAELLQAVGLSP